MVVGASMCVCVCVCLCLYFVVVDASMCVCVCVCVCVNFLQTFTALPVLRRHLITSKIDMVPP